MKFLDKLHAKPRETVHHLRIDEGKYKGLKLHLRFEKDGTGVLTINASRVLFLNRTAAYFVHSFICVPDNIENVLAESEYGKDQFCSVVYKDNVWGCQFHPERSGNNGLNIYKNFLFHT